jgi:hypothetical protein
MKKTLSIILTLCVAILILITCKKKPEVEVYDLTISDEQVVVTTTTASITADFSYPTEIYDIKFIFSTNSGMSEATSLPTTISGHTISVNLDNLTINTKYYYCYRYSNNVNLVDTDIKSFTTQSASKPTVTTNEVTNITPTTATGNGNVTNDGGDDVTERGVCWSTSHNPTIDDNHANNGTGTGEFTVEISDLTANTTYYVKAYAKNSVGTSYGEEVSFTTLENATVPTVTIVEIINITQTSALASCNVTSDGGDDVTERGVCWSTSHNPTVDGSHANNGTGTGEFSVEISDLTANTTYYVKAYAKNSVGTSYGEEVSFTTLENATTPIVTTGEITNITQTTALVSGEVTSDGGDEVTERGVCWSTSHNPTIDGNHANNGTGTGVFVVEISGLTANTKYYVKAYAKNSVGIAYGNEIEFTTAQNSTAPSVTTTPASNITTTTAMSGGNVTSDGGATVTDRGICWSTNHNPTIYDTHTSQGSGTGTFTVTMTNLTKHTKYYVRAYATNSIGTNYGNEINFTTLADKPTVTTNNVTNIMAHQATSGGYVTSDGGADVIARGVCWSTSQAPTISDSHTEDGTGTGAFTSTITGLTANTDYYLRAYATNIAGTNYGEQQTFRTSTSSGGSTFTQSFESGIPSTWTVIDNNNDGYTWTAKSAIPTTWTYYASVSLDWYHTGTDAVCSGSFINGIGVLTPDEYLVTPQVEIVNGSTISFWIAACDANYPSDHFGLAVSTTTATASEFTMIQEWTLTAKQIIPYGYRASRIGSDPKGMGVWYLYTVDLSAYAGNAVYIAIRHFNCTDQYIICVDDITLTH